ncbi:hemerythrin domain-containing protein [Devosia oryziradicis]|uniref:Hemerythrin domain-containing protein n=1 Tax=Devosia oryziradicis TaxID=2801335 RepID=A0ABX7BWN8_9HYPH|nr:hemerythrin domain-containing protein [Devosia oryziradicis]QQR36201.1 hemerythrin domain-containing protein [Devosia oryziradicis]
MLDAMSGSALREIVAGHREQIGLCKTLELIADALPDNIDPALCRSAAGAIHRVMTRIVAVEEKALTDDLAQRGPARVLDLSATIERLLRENAEDLCYAEELQETLRELGDGRRSVSADAIGYMLRGFFESRRRRIALEREILTAMAAPAP